VWAKGARQLGASNHYRRSGLFLVRIWAEETEDGTGRVECHGRVQRVADGESHQFKDWRGLVDTLSAMVSGLEHKGAADAPIKPLGDDSAK
jgi:hypothetical protein